MSAPVFRIARVIALGVVISLGMRGASTQAAQSWLGSQIMPKSNQLQIEARDEKEHPGGVYDIAWPATVEKTNGRWLFIRDEGGYSNPPAAGWVYADDVLKFDEAGTHYTAELQADKAAWLYWLRGICWENKSESAIALADYQAAEALDPQVDDVQIRLGRLIARRLMKSGTANFRSADRPTWEIHFQNAKRLNPRRAQLYFDWGIALSQACKCGVTAVQTKVTAANKGEEASDNASQCLLAAEAANLAAVGADAEISATLKTLATHPDTTVDTNPKIIAGHVSDGSGKAIAAANTALGSAQSALNAALLAKGFGAQPLDVDGDDLTDASHPPEYSETQMDKAEKLWKGAKMALQNVIRAKQAARIAAKVATRAWREADNAFTASITLHPAEAIAGPGATVTAAEVDPAVTAWQCFDEAKTLSPSWWRVPIARGELFLAQCETQTPLGETDWNAQADVTLLATLVSSNGQNSALAAASESPADAAVKSQSMDLAIQLFNDAVQLNPNSPDAYRDRAAAYRLQARLSNEEHRIQEAKSHLAAALESATAACALGNYRQPGSLKTLAEVSHDLNLADAAADYAEKALRCSSIEDRPVTFTLYKRYYAAVSPTAKATGVSLPALDGSGTTGLLAVSRGGDDSEDPALPAARTAQAGAGSGLPAGFLFSAP